MNIHTTPGIDWRNHVQKLYEYGKNLGKVYYVNIDTMKIVMNVPPASLTAGCFTTQCHEKTHLVRWCNENIPYDPLDCYNADPTPELFRDGSNERIMQVMQVMWNRLNTLETENEELREKVRCMSRRVDHDDDDDDD
jgi:hypothetical protein